MDRYAGTKFAAGHRTAVAEFVSEMVCQATLFENTFLGRGKNRFRDRCSPYTILSETVDRFLPCCAASGARTRTPGVEARCATN